MQIRAADFDHPSLRELLRAHLDGMQAHSPPGHVHALDLSGLQRPDVALFMVIDADVVVGMGALRALDDCDLLLMPTAPQRAFAFGTPVPPDQADFTALANIAGLPAIAIPWPSDGLPASVQLVGRAYAEAQIVGIAEALSAP